LAAHSGEKHNWQQILGKYIIGTNSTGKHDCQHILGKNMTDSTFWKKNMISSTFWEKKHE